MVRVKNTVAREDIHAEEEATPTPLVASATYIHSSRDNVYLTRTTEDIRCVVRVSYMDNEIHLSVPLSQPLAHKHPLNSRGCMRVQLRSKIRCVAAESIDLRNRKGN
jgi:hypothetical protein